MDVRPIESHSAVTHISRCKESRPLSGVPLSTVLGQPLSDDAPKQERALLCMKCQHVITTESSKTQVQGRHLFRFTNPHGFDYEIACFKQAPGCAPEGPSTDAFTWFPGFSWQIQRCANCLLHMGWRYEGEESSFYGLIRTHLIEKG